nr:NAD-dependent epimerase/dehydratase family protein [Pseudenhygromyxa sp. WMMC2535]
MTQSTSAIESGKLLITGATGFLGQHVVAAARAAGYDVSALVRDVEAPAARMLLEAKAEGELELYAGDVLDPASVEQAAEGCVAVLHCAGKVSRAGEDATEMTRVNVGGVEVVLDACKAAGLRRAVVASTSGTIGISTDPSASPTSATSRRSR